MEQEYLEDISSEKMDQRLQDAKERLENFIEKLTGLNQLDKYWARTDALEALEQADDLVETVKKLEKKYAFYDKAGTLRNEICQKAPDGKGNSVCNLIDASILNVSSEGRDRSWKLDELKQINKSVNSLKNEKDIAQFVSRHQELSETIVAKVLLMFDEEFAREFECFQESMGAPRFWELTKSMSPADFPNFTTTFNFRVPRDFLKNITQKNISDWPKKLRKVLLHDAEEMLESPVFKKNKSSKLNVLKSTKTVADLVSQMLLLQKIREQEELGLKQEEDRKKKQEIEEKKKKKLVEKKEAQQKEEKEQQEKEKENKEQTAQEEQKKKEQEEKKDQKEKHLDIGKEKEIIMDFYDRCISHAQKVAEEGKEWGVQPNDLEFWGQEGVKNRVKILKKKGHWKDYVKFNTNDKHIPSTARGDGFRFRWLNADTGSRISAARAESGIKYMRRYKESGYQLCVLAGAFSIDWTGSDSPVYTPIQFIEKMQGLKTSLQGKKTK